MQSNSFALFIGRGAAESLEKTVMRVDRFHRRVVVDTGDGFKEPGEGLRESDVAIAVYAIDDGPYGFPILHGFSSDPSSLTSETERSYGEFSFITRSGSDFLVGRDRVGTRPLFVSNDDGLRCYASDHRYLASQNPGQIQPGNIQDTAGDFGIRRDIPITRNNELGFEEASLRLLKLLELSVKERVAGRRKVAVAFSGGLDSSIIALIASKSCEVVLCTAFTKGSRDEKHAEEASKLLALEHSRILVEKETVTTELRAIDLPFGASPMDRALWCTYSIVARAARQNGAEIVLLGQLADELFGGYQKYSAVLRDGGAEPAERLMKEDVLASSNRGFVRDEAACARWLEPRFPFADERVVGFALGLPLSYRLSRDDRKIVLKRAATITGLPEAIVSSPKKAAQYSSGIRKLVE